MRIDINIEEEPTLAERGLRAAARYLRMRGCEILDGHTKRGDGTDGMVVVDEDGVLRFVDVRTSVEGGSGWFDCETGERGEREGQAMEWLFASGLEGEMPFAFDCISIVNAKDSRRAVLRYHMNVFGGM